MVVLRRPRALAAAALCLLGLWHLALRRHGVALPRISDEGEYAYEARVLAAGGLPYRDAYDQKPPLVFFLYRLSDALFGGTAWGPRMLAAMSCAATMLLLYSAVPPDWGTAARLTAPAVYGVLSTQPIGDMGFAANTEVFLTAFAALAAWALIRFLRAAPAGSDRRWLLLAGLAAGAAAATKQTAVWTAAALGGVLAAPAASRARRGRLADAGVYLGGCLIVPLALASYFAARGGAADMIDQVIRRNMDYAAVVARAGGIGPQLSWLARRLAPLLLAGGWPAWALAAYGLSSLRVRTAQPEELVATLWLGGALVGAATGLFFFPHYFLPALAPLGLAAAIGARRWRRAGPWLVVALSLYPAAVFARVYFVDPPETVARELLYPNPLFESEAIAEYVRAHSTPRDSLYVFGSEPQIYVEAARRAATRHIFVYPLTLFPRGEEEIARELAALSAARPKFIVFVDQPASTLIAGAPGRLLRAGVIALLGRDYRWVGTVEMRPSGSLTAFWGEETGSSGSPDWDAKDRLYLFERR